MSKLACTFQFTKPYASPLAQHNVKFSRNIASTCALSGEGSGSENLAYNLKILSALFPLVSARLDSLSIATLLASTRIVGMKVPGLNSIYSALSLKRVPLDSIHNTTLDALQSPISAPKPKDLLDSITQRAHKPTLHYTYKKHALLPCYTINFSALANDCMQGTIKAFIRPNRLESTPLQTLARTHKNALHTKPFHNQKALVIGASSGLGDVCAKLLYIGGAEVLATFYAHKINSMPYKSMRYNALKPSTNALAAIKDFAPTHIYYFATPQIRARNAKWLDRAVLYNFIDCYIFGLQTLLQALTPDSSTSQSTSLRAIFSPSTRFIDTKARDFKEYTLAKMLLESYIASLSDIAYFTPRLDKLATNQTQSILPQSLPAPDSALLQALLTMSQQERAKGGRA